jgi:hypothetical protein
MSMSMKLFSYSYTQKMMIKNIVDIISVILLVLCSIWLTKALLKQDAYYQVQSDTYKKVWIIYDVLKNADFACFNTNDK